MSKAHLGSVLKIIVSGHRSPGPLGQPLRLRVQPYTVDPQASLEIGAEEMGFVELEKEGVGLTAHQESRGAAVGVKSLNSRPGTHPYSPTGRLSPRREVHP